MKILLQFLCGFFLLTSQLFSNSEEKTPPLIPLPQNFELLNGEFPLSPSTMVISPSKMLSDYFIGQIKRLTGITLECNAEETYNKIILEYREAPEYENKEAYSLNITKDEVKIIASNDIGLFRGIQTFFQLIPPSAKKEQNGKDVSLQCCKISDSPEFGWRGLNLDCCRHFMSKDFIKRYIDILAYYKFNTFHWHLTEDQGWRIEIKKYPKLTEVGAWRKEADGSVYGGFYTQEDIKEIVAYAESRFIQVIPEIEMPGHALASLASYPENSCTGGPFEVTTIWGVHKDIYCAGRESTFEFLQNILDEVIELFPGKYIHIGGDEAPKDRWKECPQCQARIKEEGLKDEHELQSYFIKRMVNYLHSNGKEVIGWEEIIQGGLAPGIIVQSWLTYESAIEAVRSGNSVIFSPTSHTYFDYDPSNFDLQNVYSFNPIPKELVGDERKLILGSEANMWSERAPQETIDSKLFPRLLALSEVLWKNPNGTENRADYEEFHSRVKEHYSDLTALGIKYGRESKIFDPVITYSKDNNEFTIEIKQGQEDVEIVYTTDGSDPVKTSTKYSSTVVIQNSTLLKIAAFKNDQIIGNIWELPLYFHLGLHAQIDLKNKYHERYQDVGDITVLDGIKGINDFRYGRWQGYEGVNFEAVIDLGEEKDVSKISANFFFDSSSWIFLPEKVKVYLSSDGENYSNEKIILNDIPQKNSEVLIKEFTAEYDTLKTRYIKVIGESIKVCPEWHPNAGQPCWLFIDEILIY